MAFAARNEGGKWRLCLRKGRTITYAEIHEGQRTEIEFASQAKAKACADVLNDRYWPHFDKATRKRGPMVPFAQDMLDLILEYTK